MKANPFIINERAVTGNTELCGLALDLVHPENSDSRIVSVATIILHPGASSQLHFHKVMQEIYYFVQGRGRLLLGDEWHLVEPGTCSFIPPGVLHQIENIGSEPMKLISIDTPPFDASDIYFPDKTP